MRWYWLVECILLPNCISNQRDSCSLFASLKGHQLCLVYLLVSQLPNGLKLDWTPRWVGASRSQRLFVSLNVFSGVSQCVLFFCCSCLFTWRLLFRAHGWLKSVVRWVVGVSFKSLSEHSITSLRSVAAHATFFPGDLPHQHFFVYTQQTLTNLLWWHFTVDHQTMSSLIKLPLRTSLFYWLSICISSEQQLLFGVY